MAAKFRIGMITPSSNTALEPLTYAIVKHLPDTSVHFSRLSVTNTSLDPQSTNQFSTEAFLRAARLLADAQVGVIGWNGASGSWLGPDGDVEICRAIESELRIPATTTTLALLDAFRRYGVTRYSLAVPYLKDLTEKIIETYSRQGLTCMRSAWMDLVGNPEIDLVPDETFRKQLESVASPDAQAVAVVCTGVPAARFVDRMEATMGVPIFDGVIVTVWKCLEMLGLRPALHGWGRLLRGDPVALPS